MAGPLTRIPPSPTADLVDAVRHWVFFDNKMEEHQKTATAQQKLVNDFRAKKSEVEDRIFRLLDATSMRNAVLQITGATLQRATKPKQSDLSWSFLESSLHEYYKTKGRPDETTAIMEFVQASRTTKHIEYLKKTPIIPDGKPTGPR